jgi:hypothetical protein
VCVEKAKRWLLLTFEKANVSVEEGKKEVKAQCHRLLRDATKQEEQQEQEKEEQDETASALALSTQRRQLPRSLAWASCQIQQQSLSA